MRSFLAVVAVGLTLALSAAVTADAVLEIARYERQVSLKNQFVISVDKVQLTNSGATDAATWRWCTLAEHLPHLAYISIAFKEDTDKPTWQTRTPKAAAGSPEGVACVELPAARGEGGTLRPQATVQPSISAVFTKLQVPFPNSVRQDEPQNVVYSDNLYVLSPYRIGSQSIKYETFDNNIISHTKAEPMERKQRVVSYGPFPDVQPFSRAPLRLHFTNNAPFAVATTLERTLDVAWGKIGVEERYELTHGGAKLVGPWSRHDFATAPHQFAQSSFRELPAEAPASARHLYFRDTIGNISTSAVRHSISGISAALLPRTPLYGGWSTDFVFGFELPLRTFTSQAKDGRKELTYSFGPHVKGLVVDDYTLKVILPEGAHSITTELNFEADVHLKPKYTYLNKEGRTVVELHASNIVDAHNQPFVVRYRLPPFAWMREPALWGGSLAALLAAFALFARSDFSLVRPGAKAAAQSRSQATAVVSRAAAVFAERRRALTALEGAFVRPRVTPDEVLLVSRNTDAVLTSSNEKLQDALRKVEALAGTAKAGQLRTLIDREAAAAAASVNLFQQRLKLLRDGADAQALKLEPAQSEVAAARKAVALAVDALTNKV